MYFETSAKAATNVQDVFEWAVRDVLKHVRNQFYFESNKIGFDRTMCHSNKLQIVPHLLYIHYSKALPQESLLPFLVASIILPLSQLFFLFHPAQGI